VVVDRVLQIPKSEIIITDTYHVLRVHLPMHTVYTKMDMDIVFHVIITIGPNGTYDFINEISHIPIHKADIGGIDIKGVKGIKDIRDKGILKDVKGIKDDTVHMIMDTQYTYEYLPIGVLQRTLLRKYKVLTKINYEVYLRK